MYVCYIYICTHVCIRIYGDASKAWYRDGSPKFSLLLDGKLLTHMVIIGFGTSPYAEKSERSLGAWEIQACLDLFQISFSFMCFIHFYP